MSIYNWKKKCPIEKKKSGEESRYEHRKIATTSKSIVKGLLVLIFVAELRFALGVVVFCVAAWVVGVAARLDVTMLLLAEVEETAETMGS